MIEDEIRFRWFDDVCIRLDEIVAFHHDINSGTRVLLRNGREVVSRLDPVTFGRELSQGTGHD